MLIPKLDAIVRFQNWAPMSLFNLMYLFLASLGLCCCTRASLVAASGGYSLATVCRLLSEVASLAVEHGVQSGRASAVVVELGLSSCGSWA